ncbi:MAG: MmgE/PrpD family protein [Burkholderiaceae bacterium]
MARNTQVPADHDAPPVTQTLARFVAEHPSRAWSGAVDKEAHRTLLNWIGCAVGAAKHEAAEAALAAVRTLQPAAQATVLGRAERVDIASAALIKFSVYHGCAVGLTFGRAGELEFSDFVVNRPDVVELRRKIVASVDQDIDEASVDVTAILAKGRREHVFAEHAIGSLQRPMTDAQLETKFTELSAAVIGADKTKALIAATWKIGDATDVRALTALARP